MQPELFINHKIIGYDSKWPTKKPHKTKRQDNINYYHRITQLYRVFGNEGHTESGSNLIIFWPEILPKAF